MMPRKLDDTARTEIEDVACQRMAIPSDNDLAQKHKVSRSLIQHVMRLARRKMIEARRGSAFEIPAEESAKAL